MLTDYLILKKKIAEIMLILAIYFWVNVNNKMKNILNVMLECFQFLSSFLNNTQS